MATEYEKGSSPKQSKPNIVRSRYDEVNHVTSQRLSNHKEEQRKFYRPNLLFKKNLMFKLNYK